MNKKYALLMFSYVSFLGMSSLQAKIPFTHMFHLEKAFQGFEDCHPLIGWTALQKNLIYNLRFNGNFEYAYKKDPGHQHERDYAMDQGKDAVSKLVKMLFPSSGGNVESFATHGNNIGYLIKSETVKKRHSAIIAMMLRVVKAQKNVLLGQEETRKENEKELRILKQNLVTAWKGNNKFETKNPTGEEGRPTPVIYELMDYLLESVKVCVEDAESRSGAPLKRENFIEKEGMDAQGANLKSFTMNDQSTDMNRVAYPPYLVEQILMAFLCDRFDTREDILSFLRILHKEVHTSREAYINKDTEHKNNETKEGDDFILKKDNRDFKDKGPVETYIDDAYGDYFFESILPYDENRGIGFSQTGYYAFDGEIAEGRSDFSDCVESAFRQFLNILLFDPEPKNFKKPLENLKDKVKNTPAFQKLLWFYLGGRTDFASLNRDNRPPQDSRDSVLQAHQSDRFGKVIEDLNSPFNPNKTSHVYYVNSGEGNKESRFELDAGPLNMLAIFEKLLGVPLGKNGFTIDDVREQTKNEKNKRTFFEEHIKSGFENLFKLFERNDFNIYLDRISIGHYMPDIQDYCNATLFFKGNSSGEQFSFEISMTRGHHSLQDINIGENKNQKQKNTKMNKSLLKEDFYSILYSWEKEGKPLDFYRFYTTALSNQEECLDFLNAVSKNSKKGNEKFFPILEKVLQSINWYDKETVKKGILSLGRITQVMGADHPLFKNIQHLNLMYNGIKIIDESCLPSYIENLNLHGSTQLKFLSIKNMLGLKELDLSDAKSRPVDSEIRYSFGDDNKIENLPWQNEDEMPKTLELPHSLEVLNLNGRRMEMLPKGLRQLNKLKKMSFSYSFDFKEEDLPPNLEQLELENTRKNSLSLKGMPNLKKLNISSSGYNSYLEIKEGDLPLSLEELTLFSLKEKDIHIKNLTNLKKIRINYCGSLEIKEGDLPSSLEELSMTSFSGEYIPIKNLTNLKNLELSFCDFENFEGINLPLTLKKLNLNGFKKASFSIEHLTNLEELGVANGTLEKMSLPSSLKKINLSPSKVKDIHFKDFPNNLKDIRIQNKVIIHVPPCSEEQKMFLESKGAKVVISKQ